MPPRRNSKRKRKNNNLKQKRAIESRLLQISMTIERYLYNDEKITAHDAASYIEETAMYKMQCAGDERSLQVIEKITRCMNAIIAEQQENEDKISIPFQLQAPENETYCPSPVFSLLDEYEAGGSHVNNNKTNRGAIDTISLSDGEEMPRQMLVDVQIHRDMSNLSVLDYNDLSQDMPIQSQSILNDFNDVIAPQPTDDSPIAANKGNNVNKIAQKIKQNAARNMSAKTNIKNEALKETVKKNALSEFSKPNFVHLKGNSEQISSRTEDARRNIVNRKKTTINVSSKNNKNKTIAKAKVTKVNRKKGAEKLNKIDKPESLIKKDSNKTTNTHFKIPVALANKNVDKLFSQVNNQALISNTVHANTNTSNNMQKEHKSTGTFRVDNYSNIPFPTIYNTATENDLSWIENIRFVREVDGSEYVGNFGTWDSSFWENFDFPENWNDTDWDLA